MLKTVTLGPPSAPYLKPDSISIEHDEGKRDPVGHSLGPYRGREVVVPEVGHGLGQKRAPTG